MNNIFNRPLLPAYALCLLLFGTISQPCTGYAMEEEETVSALECGPTSDLNPVLASINTGQIFVDDALHIYLAPTRMSTDDALKLGLYLTATGLIFIYDQEILDMIQRNEDSALLSPLWEIGDFLEPVGHMGNTNFYYFSGMAMGYLAGFDKVSLICAQLLESHYIAGFGKIVSSEILGRQRPFEDEDPYTFFHDDATSFPSGHAINIFQVATILSYHVDRQPFTWTAYTCAGLVGIQRVRSNMHWPSDVFLSAVYGIAVAKGILALHEERKATVMPYVSNLGMGMQVGWQF